MNRSIIISSVSHLVLIMITAVIIIKTRCDTEDIIILLFTSYLSLYGSEISATLVKPDPDNKPIISNTLP